jgi:hypothetical protein
VDVCIEDCAYGPVELAVQVENVGADAAPAGAILDLYSLEDASERLVWSAVLTEIAAGTSLDAVRVSLPVSARGDGRWHLVVDGAGTMDECDESDNDDRWSEAICP